MISKYLALFIFFINATAISYGQITPINSVTSTAAKNLLKKINSDCIILINLDDTIITHKSKMFGYSNNPYRSYIETLIIASKDRPFFNKPIISWCTSRAVQLVEDEWPEYVLALKNTGAQVFGIVHLNSKIYELIPTIKDLRLREIDQLGIYFEDKLNNHELLKIANFDSMEAFFYKGVIFTGPFSKSQTLLDFLKVSNITPKKIVFFDNDINQLKQIEFYLRKFNIEYYGINYLGVTQIKTKIDEKLIKFQQDILVNQGKWLEDDEASELMKQSTTTSK